MTDQEFIESIRLEGEEWRNVLGTDYPYMVSSFGRLARLSTSYRVNGCIRPRKHKLVTPSPHSCNGKKYYRIRLMFQGKLRMFSIHTLVAMSFLPNPYNYHEVDHIDLNGLNNHISNLRWCSHKENQNNERTRKKMSLGHKGQTNKQFYTPVVRLDGDKLVSTYKSISSARDDGFSPRCISEVLGDRNKTHCGYRWMYLSDYEKLQVNMSKNS